MVAFVDENRDEPGLGPICTALQVAPGTYDAATRREAVRSRAVGDAVPTPPRSAPRTWPSATSPPSDRTGCGSRTTSLIEGLPRLAELAQFTSVRSTERLEEIGLRPSIGTVPDCPLPDQSRGTLCRRLSASIGRLNRHYPSLSAGRLTDISRFCSV